MQIESVYEPQRFEPRWAQWWVDSGLYHADPKRPGPMFSLVIPPPNVTGVLHMGHMLDHTEIDVSVRWHRMRGDNTLWIPGTDHAGIATQMVVTRELAKEGIDRHQLGREEFERRVWQWKEQSGGTIRQQMIRLGASCDWSRERFTLDPGLSRAVRETFVRLYEKGLLYRGEYMINWCPNCQTALSDLEVVHQESQGHLWHIAYPVDGSDRRVVVATTRPETMLGDTAVAVHPADERYMDLHGHNVMLPLMNRFIPVIADDMVDPKFGTGVVKITPAHDPNDFEAGRRHSLARVQVIDGYGKMTPQAGAFAGLDRFEARKRVVAELEKAGLLIKVEPHTLSIGRCQRCNTVVEPLVSLQWFVRMQPLAEPAMRVVEDGRIQIIPDNWTKVYFDWMTNIRDWCVSRQLWWGHRIPAWYCPDGHITVARETPAACAECGAKPITQDPDVLDTWFSSGLWPFSTMGWPDQTEDLCTYYPTSLLITGFDILFFWVARMIVLGLECMGDVPFRQVYMHGMVRDAERQKMSKTKGNVIDPLVVTEKYGTDAVRLSLLLGAAPGTDIIASEDRMKSASQFANKIWNASRLIFLNMERSNVQGWAPTALDCSVPEPAPDSIKVSLEDRWIFSRLNRCADDVNRAIAQYRFHEVAQTLWQFFWHEFCDWYLEMKKLRWEEGSGSTAHWRNTLTVYEMALRLLHPVMPFITEELWQRVTAEAGERPVSVSLTHYPQYNREASDITAEREMELLKEIITAAREIRADLKIDQKQKLDAVLVLRGPAISLIAQEELFAIERLGRLGVQLGKADAPRPEGVVRSSPEFDLFVRVPSAMADAQRARLAKENEQLDKNIANIERQLADEKFRSRAPQHVIEGLQAKLSDYTETLRKNRESMGEPT